MTETITDAAWREAERLYEPVSEEEGRDVDAMAALADAFVEGALFGAAWERDREPSDAEVEASAQELWKHRALGTVHPNYPWDGLAPELRQSLRELARTALSAARATRRDEEKR